MNWVERRPSDKDGRVPNTPKYFSETGRSQRGWISGQFVKRPLRGTLAAGSTSLLSLVTKSRGAGVYLDVM